MSEKPFVKGAIAGEPDPGLIFDVADQIPHLRSHLQVRGLEVVLEGVVLPELRAAQVHRHVADLLVGDGYVEVLFDISDEAPGISVLVHLLKPLEHLIAHLDLSTLQTPLDHQRDVNSEVGKGLVGDRVR